MSYLLDGGMDCCLFPVLNDRQTEYRHSPIKEIRSYEEVDLCSSTLQSAKTFTTKHNIRFDIFVAAVWSIVLARYADTEGVRFGFNDFHTSEEEGETNRIGCKDDMKMKKLTLDREGPVNQLLHLSGLKESGPNNKSNHRSFNTGISFITRGTSEISDGVKPYALQDEDCDMIILITELHDAHPNGQLLFRSSILTNLQAQNLASTIIKAMNCAIENPDQAIKDIDLISSDQIDQILLWNRSRYVPAGTSILDIIHQQALSNPNAPAIHSWDGELTYSEVDDLSSRLALHLQKNFHVKGEDSIPMLFEKSVWAFVAILGMAKAGAIFIPMDPKHPVTRLEYIVNQVQAKVILTSAQYADHLPSARTRLNVVICDPEIINLPACSPMPRHGIQPDHGAYCVFTSGSTGRPKGCLHDHRSLNTSINLAKVLGLGRGSRVLHFASFSFIRCVLDAFCTFSVGATLCIPSDHDRLNNLGGAMRKMKVNWIHVTPTMLDSIAPETVPELKILVIGGEVMRPDQIQTWSGRTRLIQTLGMTESAGPIGVSEIGRFTDHRNVGFPFRGNHWLIEPTDHQKLAPIGAVAELLLEGDSLATGYLNLPEETAEVFLNQTTAWYPGDDPTQIKTIKLYKTGDLVRYNSDGSLNYVGRKDTMVKIRGQRVEVGEVEHHILRHFPDGTKVIVDAINPLDRMDENILAAFILSTNHPAKNELDTNMTRSLFSIADEEFFSTMANVTSELHNILPSYMIPTLSIALGYMPLTDTGKVSRRELKKSASSLRREQLEALSYYKTKTDKTLPITDIEHTLHHLVVSVLNLDPQRVGMGQSFIRLGGDSVSAMRLVGMLRGAALTLSVADVMSHPKLSDLAAILSSVVENKSQSQSRKVVEPLSKLHAEQRELTVRAASVQCGVGEAEIEDVYACTALQEGLIALSEKRSGMSMARFVYRLQDNIDIAFFKLAWEQVFQANAILRTRFVFVQSAKDLLQAVIRSESQWIEATDLAKYKIDDDKTQMRAGGSPLMRVALVNGKDDRFFVLTIHHALFDQWSLRLLLSQVESVYNNVNFTLEKSNFRPFVEYINNTTGLEEYWRSEFTDLNAEIFPMLPYPNYVPKADTNIEYHIELACRLDADYTLSNAIRLAWGLVVGQYTNSDDVVFGVTVSGRGAMVQDIEKMTGPAIAMLPLRLKLNPEAKIHTGLRAVQNQATKAIPFEQIGIQNIQKLSPEAQLACKFQSHLVVQPSLTAVTERLTIYEDGPAAFGGFSNYALVLVCTIAADGLGIDINATVDSNVVKREKAQHLIELFDHFLAQVLTEPDQKINSISALGPRDVNKLREWNTILPSHRDECVHNIISQRCSENPNTIAICAWDGDLTYRELEDLSSKLAAQLARRSIGPEVFVPLMFEKSRWTIVAMLGVIKAGGAFVLLDPSYPLGRLQNICANVRCRLILSSAKYAGLCENLGFETLLVSQLETSWSTVEAESNKPSIVDPQNALYAVFTSGSTGQPKGVVIEHRSYCSAVEYYKKAFRLDQSVRVLQFSSYAFDASIIEMLTTLMVGGCVCIPSESQRRNSLPASIHALKANHAFLTPSVARILVNQNVEDDLKTLVVVGEPLSSKDVEYWSAKVYLINGYGPAECSIASCINPSVKTKSDPANIGFGSNAGTVCWVVDQHDSNKLLPIGAVGELLVEGPSVGRGYLNDAAKTKDAFIEKPGWLSIFRPSSSDSKMYKTGDLVRYDVDGSLCYVGRKDSQVKLRGQRLELGEVESHLGQAFGAGRHFVAEVIISTGESARLVAFVTVKPDSRTGNTETGGHFAFAPPSEEFRKETMAVEDLLRDSLPTYMIPTLYFPTLRMPTTASGKIDRRLLRETAAALSTNELQSYLVREKKEKQRVSTLAEKRLQGIWAQIFNMPSEQINADDNFFHLGGDSITAMKMVAAVAATGQRITVADVFQNSKLSDLAKTLDLGSSKSSPQVRQQGGWQSRTDQKIRAELLNTLVQRDDWFKRNQITDIFAATAGQSVLLSQCSIAHFRFSLRGVLDTERLRSACAAIIARHSILRTVFIEEKGQFYQVVLENMKVPFNHIIHDGNIEAYCRDLFVTESEAAPFDKPPLGFTLVSGCKEEHILIVRISHAQYDGVSFPVLIRDLAAAYRGDLLSLPHAVQFSTYITQRSLPENDAAFDFWRKYLKDSEMTAINSDYMKMNLKMDGDAVIRSKTATSIPATPAGITLGTLVKAAWSYVLSQFKHDSDIVFGQTVTGRGIPIPGVDEIQGLCLNFIPFRTTIDPENTVVEFLHEVQNQHLQSTQHDYLDLKDIVKNSTTWPTGTKFGSILQHQNKEGSLDLILDENKNIIECWNHSSDVNFLPLAETWVFSFQMVESKKLALFILTRKEVMDQEMADTLNGKLCKAIEMFTSFPDLKISTFEDKV
ncbi:hypothetical protein BP6252_11377 [Coleophoma cylindrospora]|uniref:Carrier domain-containing protein n=1 Tax=Coleophoma cylindrospora TaxID=1849047 RepID=A0A3D8QKH8_9HELO|nr:hypothetical protein BP6252_11377 [Coleophoma cylindrospora]